MYPRQLSISIILLHVILLIGCSNSDIPQQISKLPSGSVNVLAKVISVEKLVNNQNFNIKIIDVIKRGSSAPNIMNGNLLKVRVSNSLVNKYSKNEEIEKGDELNLVIQNMLAIGKENYWKVINITKESK